jgi:nucleoid-associated protein YgaU
METISPLRLILAITAILVLALIAILTVQMISFRNRYNEAQYELIAARVAVNDAYADAHILNQDLQYALTNAERENADLERLLRDLGHDPNQPAPPPDDGTRPGAGNETPQQTTPPPPEIPTLPTTHIVAPGENLFRIAQRYFGNQYQSTVNHIQTVNNITDPDRIRAGDVLQITPMS